MFDPDRLIKIAKDEAVNGPLYRNAPQRYKKAVECIVTPDTVHMEKHNLEGLLDVEHKLFASLFSFYEVMQIQEIRLVNDFVKLEAAIKCEIDIERVKRILAWDAVDTLFPFDDVPEADRVKWYRDVIAANVQSVDRAMEKWRAWEAAARRDPDCAHPNELLWRRTPEGLIVENKPSSD